MFYVPGQWIPSVVILACIVNHTKPILSYLVSKINKWGWISYNSICGIEVILKYVLWEDNESNGNPSAIYTCLGSMRDINAANLKKESIGTYSSYLFVSFVSVNRRRIFSESK